MPPVPANEVVTVNGIPLNHTVTGSGPLVVMIMGTGSPGRVWALHQVPAIVEDSTTGGRPGELSEAKAPSGRTVATVVGGIAAALVILVILLVILL